MGGSPGRATVPHGTGASPEWGLSRSPQQRRPTVIWVPAKSSETSIADPVRFPVHSISGVRALASRRSGPRENGSGPRQNWRGCGFLDCQTTPKPCIGGARPGAVPTQGQDASQTCVPPRCMSACTRPLRPSTQPRHVSALVLRFPLGVLCASFAPLHQPCTCWTLPFCQTATRDCVRDALMTRH